MKTFTLILAVLLATGCSAKQCFEIEGSGIDLTIGCEAKE